MKAVVMAGGEGSRLRPLTIGRPKPMVPIVNAPVMEHIFALLRRHGISEVVVTLQYMANAIQEYFGDGGDFGMRIHYTVEDTPLGTAGSVKNAESLLDEPFVVISGDALTDFDLGAIVQHHQRKEAMATLTLYRVPNPLEYGVVILDKDDRVIRFLEKPSWGEVFSDTVNTGIYVLDPAIFRYVPSGRAVDWSNDVFPQLLANNDPMYGCVAGGYWCDVGNLAEYMRANSDILHGSVRLDLPGQELPGRVWVAPPTGGHFDSALFGSAQGGQGRPLAKEGDAEIDPTARLYGPIFLGKGVEVRARAVIHGPTVIGDYTIVDERATIDRSVIWQNCYVGDGADLHGALIGRQCSLKTGTVVFEGAVVGDNCTIGEGAIVRPNVKLWPNKEVDAGATVSASIIWGNQARRSIFTRAGVSGLANVEMIPEFAARLGAAYGSMFPKGSMVTTNRDLSRAARMIKRGVIAGLPSAGIHVVDLSEVPVPVARYETRTSDAVGGVHVRISPDDHRVVDIKIFDGAGLNIDKNTERKVETTFFREDFRRVPMADIGAIEVVPDPARRYREAFLEHTDARTIAGSGARIVVDYGLGTTSTILPQLLGGLGAETINVNAATTATHALRSPAQHEHDLRQLATICRATGASLGALMDNDGKTIALVDDRGNSISPMSALAAFAILAWRVNPGATVAVPLTAPSMMERLAQDNGGRLVRLPANPQAQMRAAEVGAGAGSATSTPEPQPPAPGATPGLVLVGDGEGSYICPDFHPGFDGMMAVTRLLQYLGGLGDTLSRVLAGVPEYHLAYTEVPCPWERKGRVMRGLHERASRHSVDDGGQIDGVRFDLGSEWALVLPDPVRPVFHIHAESSSPDHATALAEKYAELVKAVEA
jgi:mannose-1-phosphate guanylyltransferase/phosphomannomutase